MITQKYRKEIDKAIRNLIKFSKQQTEWNKRFNGMFADLIEAAADRLDMDEEELSEILGAESYEFMAFGFTFEEFASALWDNEDQSFIDEYLKRRGWRETAMARRYLRAINASEFQLWEVTDVKQSHHVDIRLHGTSNKSVRVIEEGGTASLQQWDCLAARVIKLNKTFGFTGAVLPILPDDAAEVQHQLDIRKQETIHLMHQLLEEGEIDALPANLEEDAEGEANGILPEILFTAWAASICQFHMQPMPSFQNSDGEDYEIITVKFPVKTLPKHLIDALNTLPELDPCDEEYTWLWLPCDVSTIKDNDPFIILGQLSLEGQSLELEVNSSARAAQGTEWLQDHLGDMIGSPLTVHENITDFLEKSESDPDVLEFNSSDEGQAMVADIMERHYRTALDEPIPMLSDRSPRECAANADTRKSVVQWLKYLENQSNHTKDQDYDFSWMWKELGLEAYRLK